MSRRPGVARTHSRSSREHVLDAQQAGRDDAMYMVGGRADARPCIYRQQAPPDVQYVPDHDPKPVHPPRVHPASRSMNAFARSTRSWGKHALDVEGKAPDVCGRVEGLVLHMQRTSAQTVVDCRKSKNTTGRKAQPRSADPQYAHHEPRPLQTRKTMHTSMSLKARRRKPRNSGAPRRHGTTIQTLLMVPWRRVCRRPRLARTCSQATSRAQCHWRAAGAAMVFTWM